MEKVIGKTKDVKDKVVDTTKDVAEKAKDTPESQQQHEHSNQEHVMGEPGAGIETGRMDDPLTSRK